MEICGMEAIGALGEADIRKEGRESRGKLTVREENKGEGE